MEEQLKDILANVSAIGETLRGYSESCYRIMRESDSVRMRNVADYLRDELAYASNFLARLAEDTHVDEDEITIACDSAELADMLEEWWEDLDLMQKCDIAGVPYPTCDYGRGDEYYEAEDRVGKWWNSLTTEQKREKRESDLDWWDCE